jgi:hypothetical protein
VTGSGSDDWIYSPLGYTLSLNYTYYTGNTADLHTFQFTVVHALGFSVSTSRLLVTDRSTETSTQITTNIIHKISQSHFKSSQAFYELPVAVSYRELNWTQLDSKSKSKSHYDWRSVSLPVLVSSPGWGSWPDVSTCLKVTVLSMWGALSDERSGLSFVSHSR